MRFALSNLSDLSSLPFEDIIDVRAPSEFAEDHLPGAISLPVLSDAERAEVGTVYVRQDRFLARKIGAALVARNAADHISGPLADRPGSWRPLVYCWRGGQRSGSFASILEQIGWRVQVLEGGYRTYRRLVAQWLYDTPLPHRLIVIDGGTGTGKTQILGALAEQGAQILDLEALAEHRGSNFGALAQAQPSQKMFESRLAGQLAQLDPERPVFVEAESNHIGKVLVPPTVWNAMKTAPVIALSASPKARAQHLLTTYPDLTSDRDLLLTRIDALRPYHARALIEDWQDMARNGALSDLAQDLIEHHYDPRYLRAARSRRPMADIALTDLSASDLERAATDILTAAKTQAT